MPDITTTFNATLKTFYHGKRHFGDNIIQEQRYMRQGIESWWCNSYGDKRCTIFDTGKVTGRFVVEKIIKIRNTCSISVCTDDYHIYPDEKRFVSLNAGVDLKR